MLHLFKAKGFLLFCLYMLFPFVLIAENFVIADALLDERAANKITEMGKELFQKTGVKVVLTAKQNGAGENIIVYEKRLSQTLTPPYVLLTLFLDEKKVDVYHSEGMDKEFDKEALLSPLPWSGTIIPLLTNKKKEVGVSPALLNGYADIVDQIAAFRQVELQSSIGSSNRTTIGWVRLGIYGFVAFLVCIVLWKRIRRRD